jgi:hypothetical protein
MSDKLDEIFALREAYMHALDAVKPGSYSAWPLDMREKKAQQQVRNLCFKGVEEVFEAVSCLKNSREHRQTEIKEFDRDAFLEEVVDSFNYFFALLILTGVDSKEFFEAYKKKDAVIHDRLNNGY